MKNRTVSSLSLFIRVTSFSCPILMALLTWTVSNTALMHKEALTSKYIKVKMSGLSKNYRAYLCKNWRIMDYSLNLLEKPLQTVWVLCTCLNIHIKSGIYQWLVHGTNQCDIKQVYKVYPSLLVTNISTCFYLTNKKIYHHIPWNKILNLLVDLLVSERTRPVFSVYCIPRNTFSTKVFYKVLFDFLT